MSEWTKADDARVIELAALGCSAGKIASVLLPPTHERRSRSSVVARCRRLGVPLLGKVRTVVERKATLWEVPEVLEMLRSLWIEGIYVSEMASRISARFGVKVSRNAVIGKVHRLKLAAEFPRASGGNRETQRLRAQLASREKQAKRERIQTAKAERETVILADVSFARPWMERESGQCAFPLGKRHEVLSCCFPTDETYCKAHRKAMGGLRKAWSPKDHRKAARAA
jgi:hypothetical protein